MRGTAPSVDPENSDESLISLTTIVLGGATLLFLLGVSWFAIAPLYDTLTADVPEPTVSESYNDNSVELFILSGGDIPADGTAQLEIVSPNGTIVETIPASETIQQGESIATLERADDTQPMTMPLKRGTTYELVWVAPDREQTQTIHRFTA